MSMSSALASKTLLLTVALGSASLLFSATYRKKPYLLPSGTTGKVSLVYQTSAAPGSVVVTYGATEAANDFTAPAPAQTNTDFVYRVDMTSLTEGQRTYYKIVMDGLENTGSFVAPRGADKNDFTFYAYGDTRTSLSAHNGVAKTLLADLNLDAAARGTFVLHCGDWVATGSSETDWTNTFFNTTTGPDVAKMLANMPIYGAIGNHEGTAGAPILRKYFPYPFLPASGFYYSFDHGPVHVAVVDSETVGYSSGSVQYNWLKNDLSTSTAPVKVVMYHSPAYSANGGHADNSTAKTQIVPLFEQYGVNLVICGDNHYYARIPVKGVQHITSGGGGAPLYTPVASTANLVKSASAYHFIRFQVLNNATLLRGTAFKSDGTTIETFDVNLTPAQDEAPRITQQPANQTVNAGQTATFTVTATGKPAPTYQWKKNSTDIPGATSASYTTPATASTDNGATFAVTVSNSLGTVASNAATLTVNTATDTTFNEKEANNGTSTANVVADTATKIVGYIGATSDNDYFKFNVGAGKTFKVVMTGPTGTSYDYDLYLYNSAGTQLKSSTGSTTSETVSWTNTGTASVSVFVAVKYYKGTSTTTPYNLTLTR